MQIWMRPVQIVGVISMICTDIDATTAAVDVTNADVDYN